MRKIFQLLTMIIIAGFCFAQVSVKLQQPPPNQLRVTDLWKLTLINSGKSTLQITLNGTLEETGKGIIIEGNSKLIKLSSGSKRTTYDDVKTGNVSIKPGKWRETFTRTGNAPSGDYTICIHVKDESGEEIASDCINQRVEITSLPILFSPADGDSILLEQQPTFTWLPPMPIPPEQITYKLRIVEILGNQSPEIAIQRNSVWFEKSDIRTTMFQYPVSARNLEKDKKYAWTVQIINREGQGLGENNGTAEAFMFNVGGLKGVTKSLRISNPTDSTLTAGSTDTVAAGDTIKAGLNGEFKVIVSQISTESDSSLTGKGKVYIQWLMTSVAVEFKKIRISITKRLVSGGIVTSESGSSGTSYQDYPKAWALSLLSGPGVANVTDNLTNWTNNHIDNIVSWTNDNVNLGQPVINYQSNIPPPPIPNNAIKMPFGLQFNNGNQQLVITEMLFKPNESKINFLAQEKFTKAGTIYKLGFTGKYFKIHPNSIEFASGRVDLAEDFTLPNTSVNPKMLFTFKKGIIDTGCYIQWADSGITNIGLGIDVKFSRDWLLPNPASSDSVQVTLSGNGTSMQDVFLSGNLPNCEIVGTNGMKIQANQISLDLSDIRNPANIIFPENYPTTPGVDWQGFYMQSFEITLPETWTTGANPTQITASNIIIDDMGLTTKIKAINIFNLQSGRIADLSASLDTVEISLISSSLVSGTAKGLLVLPISDVTISNTLKYTATFAQASVSNSFQVVIVPYQDIEANILKGKMTLSSTSNISATKSSNLLTLSINLNGTFNWDKPNLSAPVLNIVNSPPTRLFGINGLKMELGFENVGLTYTNNSSTSPATNTFVFNYGNWDFASPQKLLANFPVSIKKVYYKSLSTIAPADPNMQELVRGALMIDIVANLTDDIGGTTSVGAAFAVELNKSAKKFVPKFKGVFIESIAVHANLSAVKIDGSLNMYDNDPKFGDGFKATLGVTFTAVSLQINALVQFGNTLYLNNNQYYRYWRAEADVILPVGIPFLTGVGFYGFGGGAFYNMEASTVQRTLPAVGYRYEFTPKKSALGFMAKATLATIPKFETFNSDVSLLAQFSSSNGLALIAFTGDFWLAAKLSDRPAAKIKGGMVVSYNFPNKIFFMASNLIINVKASDGTSVISTPAPVGFVMNIDGRINKWYFKFGTPTLPNTVNVLGLNLYTYLMFGNDIPIPNGFTQKFIDGYTAAIGSSPTMGSNVGSGGVGDDTKTGKGIATGVGIQFNKTYDENIYRGLCRQWSIAADLNVGAELNLAIIDQIGCPGINGYRASGDIGLYFDLTTTINGKCFACTGWPLYYSDVSSNLFTVKIGAWLGGEFPNPVYLYGTVEGEIGIFNDLAHVRFNKSFTYGNSCSGTAVATVNAPQEDKSADFKNKLIQYISPNAHYNFPVSSTINVKYSLVPDQVFDVAENQGNGTIKNRTFKLKITRSIEVKNADGTWSAKTLNSKVNNIGEYQYYLSGTVLPASGSSVQVSSQLHPAMVTSLSTNNGLTMLAKNGAINIGTIPSPVPPPPAPNYPNPIPNPVNSLVADKDYRFIVTAALMELTGTTWNTAMTRAGLSVTETKTVLFRTGGIPIAHVNTLVPRSR